MVRLPGRPGPPRRSHDPDRLARQLTLLLDGGLSTGLLDGDSATADAAKAAARALVEAAWEAERDATRCAPGQLRCPRRRRGDVTLTDADLTRIEAAVPADAVARTRYDAQQMAILDSERE